jgi:hypothetical protein
MRIHNLMLAAAVAQLCLVGCATPRQATGYVTMVYTSVPSGARVVRDGKTIGRTPYTRHVRVALAQADAAAPSGSPCIDSRPVEFVWASGARASAANACQQFTVQGGRWSMVKGAPAQYVARVSVGALRPREVPGLDRDVRTESGLRILASSPLPAPVGTVRSMFHSTMTRGVGTFSGGDGTSWGALGF